MTRETGPEFQQEIDRDFCEQIFRQISGDA